MKIKNIILSAIVSLPMLLASCDNYLEVKTYGKKLPESIDDYEQLLAGMLRTFDNNNDQYFYAPRQIVGLECYGDNLNASLSTSINSTYMPMYVADQIGSNQYRVQNVYGQIKNLNIILSDMPDQDTEKGRQIVAACHAMRGALYFILMREVCEAPETGQMDTQLGLPLVDHFDIEATPARSTLQRTIEFIENDLKTAIDMNITDDTYRFNADAARAYLAKTYLWAQDWDNCIATSKDLLDKYPLLSGDDFKNMIQSIQDKTGNVIVKTFITGSTTGYNTALRNSKLRPVSASLVKLFTEKKRDIRYTFYFNRNLLNTKCINMRIRSAEMCLNIAEAYAHKGDNEQALEYLNMLRSHRISNYTDLTMSTLPAVDTNALVKVDCTGSSLTPLMQAILNERRKEFYMEGDRWFDLKRNGSPEMWVGYNGQKYVTQRYLYTYPFAIRDLRTNKNLVQNPGYPSPTD